MTGLTPYITPTDLLGNPTAPPGISAASDAATLGVNFQSMTQHRIAELCAIGTGLADAFCGMTLRATSLYEENSGPGHRLAMWNDFTARFLTSRKPVLEVVSGQWAYGGPPWTWNTIPANQLEPEQPVMDDFGSGAWNGATSGQAAILIGNSGFAFSGGRKNTRVGIRYISGWPTAGLLPAAQQTVTLDPTVFTVTVSSATGIAVTAPVSGNGIPLNTTVTGVSGTTVTLSAKPTIAGTSVLSFGYIAGTTVLNVDDVTAWNLGVYCTIYDGINTEQVQTSTAVASTPGLPAPAGPGTVTLAAGTIFPHLPFVALSSMPQNVRWACMLAVKCQIMERGETAVVAQSVPGRSTSTTRVRIKENMSEFERLLLPYRRVY